MTETADNLNWTPPEKWAWGEIVAGRPADFAAKHGSLDPAGPEAWPDDRTLGAAFLRAILFDKKRTDKVPIDGVRIMGAGWTEPLALAHAQLKWPLCLERCRFEKPVDLTGLRIEGRLVFQGSAFLGSGGDHALILDGAAGRRADLSQTAIEKGLSAVDAAFDGAFNLTGATIQGAVAMERASLRNFILRDGNAGPVTLSSSQIARDVDLAGAHISGPLKMNNIAIGADLWLGGSETRHSSVSQEVMLIGASVTGSISLCGLSAAGPVTWAGWN